MAGQVVQMVQVVRIREKTGHRKAGGGRRANRCPVGRRNKQRSTTTVSHIQKMRKAPAGIEPTTFPLLGERTADYAKRPYKDKVDRSKRI